MKTSQSTTTTAEDTARKLFRQAGYQTFPVPIPERKDGEFAALVFTDPRGAHAALDLIERPGSHVEAQRVTLTPTKVRVYIRWHPSHAGGR